MEPFVKHSGIVVPMDRADVDTDQIIPKQFLKRIDRTGFGQFLFYDWRFSEEGSPQPDFELSRPGYEAASILVTGRNFGSGSSREHAVWALLDYGFRCIIASSFADIFYNNCFLSGLLPVVLPEEIVRQIVSNARLNPGYKITVDLKAQRVCDNDEGLVAPFQVDEFRRDLLLKGLDSIDMTLQHVEEISSFESRRSVYGGVLR